MNKKIKNFTLASLIAAAVPNIATAGDVTFRFAHWLPTTHPLAEASFPEWAESITKASNGSIKFEFYPAQQLGVAKDHYNMARDGIADVTWIGPGYEPGRFPVLGAVEFPFVVANTSNANAAVHSWYESYADKEMSDVKVCITHLHSPGTLHSKTKVQKPSDIKGMNIRPSTASVASYVNRLGGANVQVAAPEARDALEKGSADAIFYPNGSFFLYNLDHIAKFHIDAPIYTNAFNIVFNKSAYDKLDKSQKEVIDSHCNAEWSSKVASHWDKFEQEGMDRLRESDEHVMTALSDADLNEWIQASTSLKDEWKGKVSRKWKNPEAIIEDLNEKLEAHSAKF